MIVVLAVVGVLLVRRRGISQAGVDPYLAAVPVLASTTAGLLALRLYPWAMRLFGWLAARHRGGVAFLGLAMAGRVSVGAALPLVVIVLAVAVGGFASSVRVGLSDTRDVASARMVGGDLRLSTAEFAPDAVGRVGGVPGVTAVASGHLAAQGSLRTTIDTVADPGVAVLVLDTAAYQRVLARIGLDLRLPEELASARPGGDVPVVVSAGVAHQSDLAVRLGGGGLRRLRVVATLDVPPGLSRVDFVVVPRKALDGGAARISLLFVAGPHADPAAVRAAARPIPGATPDDPVGPDASAVMDSPGVALITRVERRRALERSGFNDGITLAFNAGAAAALIAGLLAIGLALIVDAAARGRALSLLRTMGLGSGQARGLLLVELMPLMVTAMATGAAVGVILPALLGPALGLSAFTAGAPLAIGLDGRSVGLLAALLLLLVLGGALTEAAVNRRLGLGQVLRVA
jgi:putative ABC transport system permease protein